MEPKKRLKSGPVLAVFLLSLFLFGGPQAGMKLKVTAENASIKATPEIAGVVLILVPPNTVLDAELKQGEFYKVTWVKEGFPITGYIHELHVQEVSDAEAQQAMAAIGLVKTQDQIIVELGIKLDENRNLVILEKDLPTAVTALRPLLARAFTIDDRQKQRQLACEIYYWLGLALAKQQDNYGALIEFRNMFEVDPNHARDITRTLSDPIISGFIDLADKQYRGVLVDFSLEITSEPKEATIKIDGKEIARTPHLYRSSIPKFALEIEKEGFKPYRESVFLYKQTETRNIKLESTGRTIILKSLPKEAQVFLDGQDTGELTDCELPYVPYGARTISLIKKDHANWEETIQVLEGAGPLSLEVSLIPKTYLPFNKWGSPDGRFYKMPRAITFDKEGNYYLLDATDFKARKFDAEGRLIGSWSAGGQLKDLKDPGGIAVDSQGIAYITDSKACSVMKFGRDGRLITRWGKQGVKPGEFSNPIGIAVDASNNVYVADSANNRIAKYSPQGTLIKAWGKLGTGQGEFNFPTGVAVNLKNEIVVVDKAHVQKFSPDGDFLAGWGRTGTGQGELNRPMGICIDELNCVYVADTGNNRILKFDGNGRFISQWGSPGVGDGQMMSPTSVAISGKKSVFVVEKDNNRLQEFRGPSQ